MLAGLIGFSSCNTRLTPFSEDLYHENGWSDDDLKRIQFYLSEDIILRRGVSEGSSTISSGKIKIVNGKKIEETKIKKGTPGVFLFRPKDDRFAVSFESGDKSFLIFGPSEKKDGMYTLRAAEWDQDKGQGEVTYNGKKYYTPSKSAYATLMVDLKKAGSSTVKSRTAKGRTVKD
jgi:hypothetical protein